MANGVHEEGITGKLKNRGDDPIDSNLDWAELFDLEVQITHYAPGITLEYTSPAEFLLKDTLGLWRVDLWKDRIAQRMFNFSTPVRTETIKVLRALVDARLNDDATHEFGWVLGEHRRFISYEVLELVHGYRVYDHPDVNYMGAEIQLTLEALVAAGDLKLEDQKYQVLGAALTTISEYEEDNRRHKVAVWQNWLMVFLTFAIASTGIVSYLTIAVTSAPAP